MPSRCRSLPWLLVTVTTALTCLPDEPRFGPPNGLHEPGMGDGGSGGRLCALPPGVDASGATCPDWTTEVFPLLDQPYACTSDGCHGDINGSKGLTLVSGDGAATYAALAAYDNADGHPYIRPGGTDDAYILCNVWNEAPRKLGSRMPIVQGEIPLIQGDDLITIGNWVACGMPENGAGGSGGSGSAGGGQGGG